jgi:hypothetical protein
VITRLSGRVAALLAAATVLVVLLAGWFVLVSPQRSKAAELQTSIDVTQAQVISTQAYVDSPATKRAVHDLKRLQLVLPDDPRISQVLRQLSAAAGQAGVSVDSISPAAAIPSSGGETVPIGLSVTGHYFNISRFLHILREEVGVKGQLIKGTGRLYSADSITFTGGGSSTAASSGSSGSSSTTSGSDVISASIALNVFVYAPAAAIPTTSGTTTTASP